MGRAGSGSSSHSSSGHSASGHRVSSGRSHSSSRSHSGSGSYSRSRSRSYGGGGYRGSRGYRGHRGSSGGYRGGGGSCGGLGCGGVLAAIAALVVIIFIAIGGKDEGTSSSTYRVEDPVSSIVREKLNTGSTFDDDCITDELGWFENADSAGKALKNFYDKTGVQPYIYLRGYDASLADDDAKDDWAVDYYESTFEREDVFLFVYFAEKNADEDVGYMCIVPGTEAKSVMDEEAQNVFWDYIDRYWYTDLSTDALFENVFDKTASVIMFSGETQATSTEG